MPPDSATKGAFTSMKRPVLSPHLNADTLWRRVHVVFVAAPSLNALSHEPIRHCRTAKSWPVYPTASIATPDGNAYPVNRPLVVDTRANQNTNIDREDSCITT